MNKAVVGNDIDGNDKALVVITGANQGGKSTFLRSVGLAQVMMQSGLFVGAEAFGANIVRGVFTHYKREEDTSMTSGKFDEELSRMNALADMLGPHSLILFNESFASTNEREGFSGNRPADRDGLARQRPQSVLRHPPLSVRPCDGGNESQILAVSPRRTKRGRLANLQAHRR